MKNNLKYIILSLFTFTMLFSCIDDDNDELSKNAVENNAIVKLRTSTSGKLLGIPSSLDFETATVAFTETMLDLEVFALTGGQQVSEFQITKSLNGGNEVVVATSQTLPMNLNYTSGAEFVDGLGITMNDLRIGDQIIFRTKFLHSDGSSYYASDSDGTYKVTISCSSDLVGNYNLTMVASNGWNINFPNELVIEKGVGLYKTESTYRWAVGSIAPDQGFDFQDVCGELTVPSQGLAQGYYSNNVEGTEPGQVDGTTGNLKLYYSVEFASGTVTCVGTYVKL